MNDFKSQSILEGIEVAVDMEECVSPTKAERGDETVDCLPDCAASLT